MTIDANRASCHGVRMRWEHLFADLAARFDEIADEQMQAELADRRRAAVGAISIVQRCLGSVGQHVRVRTVVGSTLTGELVAVGPDWLLLDPAAPGQLLLPLEAMTAIEGLGGQTGVALSRVDERCDLRLALRGLARDRSSVLVTTVGSPPGAEMGGSDLAGTIDRVGRDFIEVAQHPAWEARRADQVRGIALVPLATLVSVRSRPMG